MPLLLLVLVLRLPWRPPRPVGLLVTVPGPLPPLALQLLGHQSWPCQQERPQGQRQEGALQL